MVVPAELGSGASATSLATVHVHATERPMGVRACSLGRLVPLLGHTVVVGLLALEGLAHPGLEVVVVWHGTTVPRRQVRGRPLFGRPRAGDPLPSGRRRRLLARDVAVQRD